jgi:uncharacterized membrane protein YphA (DoxX/SURF4 family)
MPLRAAQALGLIRMAFGLYFVVSALRKTTSGWLTSPESMTAFIERNTEASTLFYRGFLESSVLPNADRFAQLVVLGEWVAGVCLLGGLLTRLGALSGMWLMLNYMLAKGLPSFEGSQDRLFFASCAVFALSGPGLALGLDGVLRPYLGSNPIFHWLAGVPSERRMAPARVLIPDHRRLSPARRRRAA